MTNTELAQLRDEMLDAAKQDLAAATEVSAKGGDARSYCNTAMARRELAGTLDTMIGRARDARGEGAIG